MTSKDFAYWLQEIMNKIHSNTINTFIPNKKDILLRC